MKTSYAFDFAAEIVSDKPFSEIPVKDLCDAMRQRLDRVEAANEREAFDAYDAMEVD